MHLATSPLEFMQRLAALIRPAESAPAKDCFAAAHFDSWMTGLGRVRVPGDLFVSP